MKDIPVFTTDFGVATLILKEIPYRQIAYIRVHDVQPGKIVELVDECAQFCRGAGAQRIFATGYPDLARYPLGNIVYSMALTLTQPAQPEANLWPVTKESVSRWRAYYNNGMQLVDNAATLTAWDEKELLSSPGAYFVHEDGALLGIGWMKGSELAAIVSVKKGMGETVARTLFTAADSDRITLEVVSTNDRALRLYHRLGFLKTGERARWYQIR